MLSKIEEIILNAIKENFSEFECDSFPIKFEDYEFTSPKGCILIRFENKNYGAQKTVYSVSGEAETNFTVFFALRYAQKHSETYEFLEELEKTLIGLNIMSRKLVPDKLKFETEINGDLWYSFGISIELPFHDENKNLSPAAEELDKLFSQAG